MSGDPLVRRWTRAVRLRGAFDDITCGVPLVLAGAVLGWRLGGATAGVAAGAIAALVLAAILWRRARRFGTGWLVRQLDATRGDVEDSADLLFADPAALGALQTLQRQRVAARLASDPPVLRTARPIRALAVAWAIGAITIAAALLWPTMPRPVLAPNTDGGPVLPGVPRLVGQRLRIVPPAYTGLPARDLDTLDARAPQGSRLIWTLAFSPEPRGADLLFLDGRRLSLAPRAQTWGGGAVLDRSALYRIRPAGARQLDRLHRLDAVPDQPPSVVVRAPRHTLTIATRGQRRWSILVEARDDYGVAPVATLRLTVVSGEGEQVTFRERTLTLGGIGSPRQRRFAVSLDLAALGFVGPGDLVADLTIADTRAPLPQQVRAPSLILRRLPAQAEQSTGLDGALRSALPAYLRSQRQVINDAEALLRQRRALPAADFAAKSQAIGWDQQALRLHYGKFLGQEDEGSEHDLPTAEAPATPVLGRAEDVLAEYGHTHDDADSATLFDPVTKARLNGAVEQMWQSELALNQGDPARALPYANRALVLIKQVQQATRIFLARVGTGDLPPIDEGRRLSGVREGVTRDDLALAPEASDDGGAARIWAALAGPPPSAGALDAVARWAGSGGAKGVDPLALSAALDAARRAPGCGPCRERLRALVWQGLRRPPPGVAGRADGGRIGARYLDALGGGR